jgi:hypothetical protein
VDEHGPHRVVALALPAVVAFDLSIAAQLFGHRGERSRYSFSVCSSEPGPLPTSTGFDIDVRRILEAETVSGDIPVSGWSYDVATGLVSPVVPAASRRGRSA